MIDGRWCTLSASPKAGPGIAGTMARCVELTGLRWGAAYRLDGDGGPELAAHAGVENPGALRDFFGRAEILTEALDGAAGRIMRLRNTGVAAPDARSVLARAGLSMMLVVPVGDSTQPAVVLLGAHRSAARWYLGKPGHTQRVSRYCRLLARLAGLPHRRSDLIGQAAALHDVGKLAVPEVILLKPGPLTEAERRRVELHSEHGHWMLAGHAQPLSELAATIAWTHHERWDGRGYPRGLAGDEIPLEGRIAAIADVFDALTSDRAYRPAMSPGEALALMTGEAGRHFDPELLRLFIGAAPRLLALRERAYPRPRPAFAAREALAAAA